MKEMIEQRRKRAKAIKEYGTLRKAVEAGCLLYTSDAADEEDSVNLGGRRNITKKKKKKI